MKSRAVIVAMVGLVLASAGSGCRLTAPAAKPQSEEHAQSDITQTQNQIRLRMRGLVGPMCAEVEQAADRIAASSTNRAVQAAAREWKLQAVPALRGALFQPDPLTALADTWVLCIQMADFFDSGPGKVAFGEYAPAAVTASRALEERLAQDAAALTRSGDVSDTRAWARRWAAEHPIEHSIAGRESTLSRALPRDAAFAASAGEVVVEMATAVDDLNRKLDLYSGQLTRQARWEAEALGSDIMAGVPFDRALSLVERAVEVAEGAPKVIGSEREVAIKALQDELARTIQFAQEERIAALAHLTQERVAALNSLKEDLELVRAAFTEDVYVNGVRVADHAIWRLAQVAGILLVGAFLAAALLLLLARRLFLPVRNLHP